MQDNLPLLPEEKPIIGISVRLRCYPLTTGWWSTYWILPNGDITYDDLLSLSNIGREDEGTYLCKARKNGLSYIGHFILRLKGTVQVQHRKLFEQERQERHAS